MVRHSGGSITFETHKENLEKQFGAPVSAKQLFAHTHAKRKNGEWVDNKSKNTSELYHAQIIKKYGEDPSSHPAFDSEEWIAAAGPPKKGLVYGLGTSLVAEQVLASSSASYHPTTSYGASTQSFTDANASAKMKEEIQLQREQMQQAQEHIQLMQQQMEQMMQFMKQIMQHITQITLSPHLNAPFTSNDQHSGGEIQSQMD